MFDSRKIEYFDALASRWDEFTDHDRVRSKLRSELDLMHPAPREHIVDLGCGTGNLTAVLLEKLGPEGKVTAVDFSGEMVERAKQKFSDPRVQWYVADAAFLPMPPDGCDRVICFSAWPHFPDAGAVLRETYRILKDDGRLTILHIDGRQKINEIHSSGGEAIARDLLPPAGDLASMFPAHGFVVEECVDTPDRYCITGRVTGGNR
jgi:ubiquinone/menaquinone biosynthesis C-methylase UbiE